MKRAQLGGAGNGGFGGAGVLASDFGVKVHKGVQLALQGLDAVEMGFEELDGGNFPGANGLGDLFDGGVEKRAHRVKRESMRAVEAGQARKWACEKAGVKTVDDARVSRENSKCARKRRAGVAGIPRGQEEKYS